MSNLVDYKGRTVPRCLFEPEPLRDSTCAFCGDVGMMAEQLDDDRLPVMMYCPMCRRWDKESGKWVKKERA